MVHRTERISLTIMLRSSIICVSILALLAFAQPAVAWPDAAYSEIFNNAAGVLPPPLKQLLEDIGFSPNPSCATTRVEGAVEQAIQEFSSPNGSLPRAISAMKDAGCAIAALNDPGMNALVESQQQNFALVFYGWHPVIEAGNLGEYLRVRNEERQRLLNRFGRSSELPNLSENVELSPEFGMASIAFSHAVTDVANIWLYVWTSVNGALQ